MISLILYIKLFWRNMWIDPIKIALEPNFNLSSESKDILIQKMKMIIDDYPIDYIINKKLLW